MQFHAIMQEEGLAPPTPRSYGDLKSLALARQLPLVHLVIVHGMAHCRALWFGSGQGT